MAVASTEALLLGLLGLVWAKTALYLIKFVKKYQKKREQESDAIILALAAEGVTKMNSVVREALLQLSEKYDATDIYYYIKHKLGKQHGTN